MPFDSYTMVNAPNMAGGVLFWLGGWMELRLNGGWGRCSLDDPVWWISWMNYLGGFMFFVGASAATLVGLPAMSKNSALSNHCVG